MTALGASLLMWLKDLDKVNGSAWYDHLLEREFACLCAPFTTYCPEWRAVIDPPTSSAKANSFWLHTNPTTVSDALLQREIPRRRYVVLNAWEHGLVPKIKAINPDCTVLVYKDISSVRSYDTHTDVRLVPAGMTYARAAQSDWQARDAGGRWLQYSGYDGHYQMLVGAGGYQSEWATNVAKVKGLDFDGVWMDNALWNRDTYHPGVPVRGYASDEAWREAYRSFFRSVCPKLKAAGLLSVANMTNARLVTGGWQSYLDAGLDGGFDEWWVSVDDTGTNLLPEYPEGWRRQVEQVAYAEAQGKIALVQPHFPVGNVKAFRYTYASYLMGYPGKAGKAAFAEANGTDQYGNPTPWHAEFDWDLGEPTGLQTEERTNVFTRYFTNGCVVVNANKAGAPALYVPLWNGEYLTETGSRTAYVSIPGVTGRILRRA